ncbi:MAG: 30S ribosomal protein S18 [Elusimicrobiota bacterium]|jgi:small subunit ribosomal protein S18|nr:30S ribosomal protein S18 [Elusimicrobiota bacterium]
MAMQNFKKSGNYKPGGQDAASRQGGGRMKKSPFVKKKICRFCAEKLEIDYKNTAMLRSCTTDSGKILSGRVTGTCAKHQRQLGAAVKRARMLAFLPFTTNN